MTTRAVLLLAMILLLPAALIRPPSRQQELRVLVTARNMVESGDYLRPTFQNQPRYRKPPMPYWAAALPMALTRVTDQAIVGRLFFVGATLGMLLALMRLAGGTAGVFAGILMLLSHGLWRFGVLAETDTLNLLGMVLAFLGWQKRSGALSGFGMCVAVLSKGPAGLAIPLLSMVALHRRHPHPLRFYLLAFLPPLLCGAAWLYFLHSDPGARAALVAELNATFANTQHRNPLGYYLYTTPKMLLPGLLLALALRKPADEKTPPLPAAPFVWFAITFLLLTLTVSKQNHYALMLMPPAAWALGAALSRRVTLPRPVFLLGPVLLVACAEVPRSYLEHHSINARFLRGARPLVEEATTLHVVGINSARFDFHLGRHVENIDSATIALRRARPGEAVVIVQQREQFDAADWPASPTLSADDGRYIRRVFSP